MEKPLVKKSAKTAEEKLRKHIRRVIAQTRRGQTLSDSDMRTAENETLALFEKYGNVPMAQRDDVWAEGKRRILLNLGK